MTKSKSEQLHTRGFYLSNASILPGSLGNLPAAIAAQQSAFSQSTISAAERDVVILSGANIGRYSASDLNAFGPCPQPPQHRGRFMTF